MIFVNPYMPGRADSFQESVLVITIHFLAELAKDFARLYSPAYRIVQPIRHDQPVARVLVEQLVRLDV